MVINLTSKLEWTPYDYGTMVYQIITETAPPSSWLQAHSFRIFGRTPKAMVHTKLVADCWQRHVIFPLSCP